MRALPIIALSILTVAPAGVAVASVPPTLPEPPPESVSVPEVSLATPDTTQAPDDAVRVVNDTGDPMATIVVESAEPAWTGYAEGDEPDGGNEYLRVVVTVQNDQTDDSLSVNVDHFIVQDANGFITQAESIKTAEESDTDADVITDADLNGGEGLQLALVFEITTGVDAQRLYYRPSDDRLVDVANLT